jgi:hypothetical protein
MIGPNDARPLANILREYQQRLTQRHPSRVQSWPLLNGWNLLDAGFKGWRVLVIQDAAFSNSTRQNGVGELSETAVGVSAIASDNREAVRRNLEQFFNIGSRDVVFLWPPNNNLEPEFDAMLLRHELALGIAPMKVFLSHKGADKPLVRQYKETLQLLGFDPWLDEDAMTAGENLERGLLNGFHQSCAAVFFITPAFSDEKYLATEVDYAIAEKRKKGDEFAIIALVFETDGKKGSVPALLHNYVWKEPHTDLEALQEIIRALPICVGGIRRR